MHFAPQSAVAAPATVAAAPAPPATASPATAASTLRLIGSTLMDDGLMMDLLPKTAALSVDAAQRARRLRASRPCRPGRDPGLAAVWLAPRAWARRPTRVSTGARCL